MIKFFSFITALLFSLCAAAQIDPALLKRIPKDTIKPTLNMDAVYNRPFVTVGKLPVSVGGYMEANWQQLATDGISEGHQFQFRRMTLFVSSTIGKRLKFLSEIEFEDGAKEISIEFAALDIELHPLINLRGGIILNPIGAFNQNHDGPKWEFTDRPIAATQMLPATWSNAGFGVYGKHYNKDWMFGYEAYLSGNFDNTIIDNAENKTFLPAAKNNKERFEEMNSGLPLLTTKVAVRNNKIGELGISYMGGVYNKFQDDGLQLDDKRRVDVFAIDFNTTLSKLNTFITAEWAWIKVNVPSTFTQQYGNKQQGGFVDIVQPLIKKKMPGWPNATLNLACRFEYVDWNKGTFTSTGGNIADDLWSILPAISFRPTAQTVLRFNYRHQSQRDLLGNPPAKRGDLVLGFQLTFKFELSFYLSICLNSYFHYLCLMKNNTCIRLFADQEQIMNCKSKLRIAQKSFASLSNILALAGNEVRLKIIYLLEEEKELCPCDLADILGMSIPAVSQHLRKLKDGSIVETWKEGQTIYYSLSQENLKILKPFFKHINIETQKLETV